MLAWSSTAAIIAEIVSLLLIATTLLAISRRLRLPYTIVLVLAGMGISILVEQHPQTLGRLHTLGISSDLIFLVFLPTLVFNTAFSLETRSLRHNMGAILTLAVPGMILSTALIGLIVAWGTGIPLLPALLLGAILSATDPVAVIALFTRLGAPQRLTILVEGESLFNDATSVVLAGILIAALATGETRWALAWDGTLEFLWLFVGGVVLGLGMGRLVGWLIGWLRSDPMITLTLLLALPYLAFLLAEHTLGVSGIMAVAAAGLTLAGWGRTKISHDARAHAENQLGLLAFFATSLIFLMVGLAMAPQLLLQHWQALLWVVAAMLVARAAMVFGLLPLVGRLPGSLPIRLPYQVAIFWGGLRGAIALAIVLGLPPFPFHDLFVALTMGAVLFTLLVHGLTIEPLVHRLGLDRPTLGDRLVLLEGKLLAHDRARQRIPELQAVGGFSRTIARRLQAECDLAMTQARRAIEELRQSGLDPAEERKLLFLRTFGQEQMIYTQMYQMGHLSEGAFRELMLVLAMQIDAVRHHGTFAHIKGHAMQRWKEQRLIRPIANIPLFPTSREWLRTQRIVRFYEEVWGHYQGSGNVLRFLDNLKGLESIPPTVVEEVRSHYRHWFDHAAEQLDRIGDQFPEFSGAMQERMGKRLILTAEKEVTEEQLARGLLPPGAAETLTTGLERQMEQLRGTAAGLLPDDPLTLLGQLPIFYEVSDKELQLLADQVRVLTLGEGQTIIQEGERCKNFFIVARGVVRISRTHDDHWERLGVCRTCPIPLLGER
ncbi:MAG: hypothetical protein COX57_04890 [Alphaproteobacteria bacterium CG_4_10_14_0_2_um_filter_63_37]|nr:MAG: hypothetical protein COX57_04890 [Alphaproteobacteria bacterium CG_4_10_14_0_2_um_filter_63_37]